MKTVDISIKKSSVLGLLNMAKEESVLVKTKDGDAFVISAIDEFNSEVELLRKNHKLLAMLDKFKEEDEVLSIDLLEKNLRRLDVDLASCSRVQYQGVGNKSSWKGCKNNCGVSRR